jgi:hypothetical protein
MMVGCGVGTRLVKPSPRPQPTWDIRLIRVGYPPSREWLGGNRENQALL